LLMSPKYTAIVYSVASLIGCVAALHNNYNSLFSALSIGAITQNLFFSLYIPCMLLRDLAGKSN